MLRRLAFILIFFLPLAQVIKLSAQTWIVPEENKKTVAPFRFTKDMQKKGEQLYIKNCQSCHGLPGKNNFIKLTPPPGDLATNRVSVQTDGELFYRITTGKTPMPEFRNVLSEEERWWIVSYIRTFHSKYVQPEPVKESGFTGKKVNLVIDYLKEKNKVRVTACEPLDNNVKSPVKGIGITLFVKRYFGSMQLGEIKITNEKGIADFDFPVDLPGDKTGMVEIVASVNPQPGNLSETRAAGNFLCGVPTDRPSLIATRAWWSTRDKAPVWVIVIYSCAVLIAWAFIIYILISIFNIRKVNNPKYQSQ